MIDIKDFNDIPPTAPRSPRFPAWLKKKLPPPGYYNAVCDCISQQGLHTVCAEARCPNRAECWSAGTATFLIMGNVCTRNCGFCGVGHGTPGTLDANEPEKVSNAAKTMALRHIVITSVTRDDLPLGGAEHFAETVARCKTALPQASVEALIPDFDGSSVAVDLVLAAAPDILNHNLETVPRLYPQARPRADYGRSLDLLAHAAGNNVVTKSGIMVGLGETEKEVFNLLNDLQKAGCRIVTIGQYLRPSALQLPVVEFVPPEQFALYEQRGKDLGFLSTFAGPFVRSSYKAGEIIRRLTFEN